MRLLESGEMKTVQIIAHKATIARFTVDNGSRKEIEEEIAAKFLSGEIDWKDNEDSGINVTCVKGNEIWRPRRRFFLSKEDEAAFNEALKE
jgi:hypothetical protein